MSIINFYLILAIVLNVSIEAQSNSDLVNSNSKLINPNNELIEGGQSALPLLEVKNKKQDHLISYDKIIENEILNQPQASFAQMIDNQKGVDTQTSCAFCGAKRVTINGLKGEHTTLLIDGLPLHSTVSSFYGVEAVPVTAVEAIDVYRGAGASLSYPEAIGGVIDIKTKKIRQNQNIAQIQLTDNNQEYYKFLISQRANDKWGWLIAADFGSVLPLDKDSNNIAEVPRQKNTNVTAKSEINIFEKSNLDIRLSYADLKTVGGVLSESLIIRPPQELAKYYDFIGFDVRNPFIGIQDKITDNISVSRYELALKSQTNLGDEQKLNINYGLALQKQKAIYSHGYDYLSDDHLQVGQINYQFLVNYEQILKVGLDYKNQKMDSSSEILYQDLKLAEDDFTYQSLAFFIEDQFQYSENTQISLSARVDQVDTKWIYLKNQIQKTLLAPRLFIKHQHNLNWISRAGYGLGYRSPLTLFESQHGTNHYGFVIDIDQLETAHSYTYSLERQGISDYFQWSAHFTDLYNMAYGLDRALSRDPTIFKNADSNYLISAFDISYEFEARHGLVIELQAENFNYPFEYKNKLPVAAIENRILMGANYQADDQWNLGGRVNITPEQDLSSYGYHRHYNQIYEEEDFLSPDFGKVTPSHQKWQKAPWFATVDMTATFQLSNHFQLQGAINNIFDYTQTQAGDSPTTWHLHGAHYHLDNFHIWGPLRGRQIFISLQGDF